MKKLLIFLKDYKKECILGPLFKMLEAIFELFVPLVIAAIIDFGIGSKDKTLIYKNFGILVILAIIGFACAVTAQYFAAKAAAGFAKKVKHALFYKIQKFSYSDIDKLGTSSLITNMTSDINQVQTGVNLTIRLLLRSPFVVFGAMIMAFTVDKEAAVIFAVTIPVLVIIVFGIMLGSVPLYKKVQSKLDKILNTTRENLSGVRVVRAFCKEEVEIEEFKENNAFLYRFQMVAGRISALLNPVTFLIINAAIIVLMYVGAINVNDGKLSSGEVVALYNYMSQILVELIKMASLIITLTKSVASGNRIGTVLQIPIKNDGGIEKTFDNSKIAVEFKNVSLKYDTASETSLENISFSVKKGQTVGIIGGTGSGKTSLVNMIPKFYTAFSGEVLVNGKNVNDVDTKTLREKIAIVPQKAVLFKGTVRDNMLWGNSNATDGEINNALKIAQATEVVAEKGGLDAAVEQGGKNFSGGQRQRLTIARALIKKAEILIFDDSSSALDYATDAALRKAISEIENKPTVFIVSQRTAAVSNADLIIVLEDGEAVGMGKHEDLLETCDVYKEIYDSQFKGGDRQ